METSSDAINERKAISRLLGVRQKDIHAERERDRKIVRERTIESEATKRAREEGGAHRPRRGQ